MSVQFMRLSSDFAKLENIQGQALPTESRLLKQWLDNLPRGNAKEVAIMLRNGLAQNFFTKMEGSARYNLLEMVRADVLDSVTWLKRQFIGSPLPLVHDRLMNAQLTLELHALLADSYRLACYEICFPNGSIPMLKSGAVGGTLARSVWHYQQTLMLTWSLYQGYPKGIWQGLHRVYQFAKLHSLDKKDMQDPCLSRTFRIHDMYCETALVSLMNPFAFAQSEQDQIRSLAVLFAPDCVIERFNTSVRSTKVPKDGDLAIDADLPDDDVESLNFSALLTALDLAEQNKQGDFSDVELSRTQRQSLHVSVLKKIRRALGLASARVHTRLYENYQVETIVALNSIHFAVAGRIGFDSYVQNLSQLGSQGVSLAADWTGISAETQTLLPATVLDHSLGGYRLLWPANQALRLRVGEIIGLNNDYTDADPLWMIGVLRWLRFEQDGSIMAGVKLLARRCNAVALSIKKDGRTGNLVRGLELSPLESQLPVRFLTSGRLEQQNQDVDVIYGYEPNRFGSPRQLESLKVQASSIASNMDYTLLVVQPI